MARTGKTAVNRRVEVAAHVRQLRAERGLSQNRLAALCEVHPLTIAKAELAGVVTYRTALRLGAALGEDPATLVTSI